MTPPDAQSKSVTHSVFWKLSHEAHPKHTAFIIWKCSSRQKHDVHEPRISTPIYVILQWTHFKYQLWDIKNIYKCLTNSPKIKRDKGSITFHAHLVYQEQLFPQMPMPFWIQQVQILIIKDEKRNISSI